MFGTFGCRKRRAPQEDAQEVDIDALETGALEADALLPTPPPPKRAPAGAGAGGLWASMWRVGEYRVEDYSKQMLCGVACEAWFKYRARWRRWFFPKAPKPHTENYRYYELRYYFNHFWAHIFKPREPTTLRCKNTAGQYITVDASMDDRVPDALESTRALVEQAERRLKSSGFHVMGADARIRLPSGVPKSIDVRLQWKRPGKKPHLVICELKYSGHVGKAEREAKKHWATLSEARRGSWSGPHPKAGKPANCRYTGTLALSPRELRFRIRRNDREIKFWRNDREVDFLFWRMRQQASGAANRTKYGSADGSDEEGDEDGDEDGDEEAGEAGDADDAGADGGAAAAAQVAPAEGYDSADESTDSVASSSSSSSMDC